MGEKKNTQRSPIHMAMAGGYHGANNGFDRNVEQNIRELR